MPHEEGNSSGSRIKSVRTSLKIIDELMSQDGATVSELAESVNVSKSTAHKHLSTLREYDYVVNNSGQYQLSLRFLDIGGYALYQFDQITKIESTVKELANETGETAQFSTEQHGRSVVLSREAGSKGVFSRTRLGNRLYMHRTATGKAILANLPDQRVEQIIEQQGLPVATDSTITTESELYDELKTIRDRGYSLNKTESTEGLHAVGAPLRDPEGNILGAFAVVGPSQRLNGERFKDEIPDVVRSAVNELELNIKYS